MGRQKHNHAHCPGMCLQLASHTARYSPLHLAAQEGHLTVVEALLNATPDIIDLQTDGGDTGAYDGVVCVCVCVCVCAPGILSHTHTHTHTYAFTSTQAHKHTHTHTRHTRHTHTHTHDTQSPHSIHQRFTSLCAMDKVRWWRACSHVGRGRIYAMKRDAQPRSPPTTLGCALCSCSTHAHTPGSLRRPHHRLVAAARACSLRSARPLLPAETRMPCQVDSLRARRVAGT
jgi:hypothetical protein